MRGSAPDIEHIAVSGGVTDGGVDRPDAFASTPVIVCDHVWTCSEAELQNDVDALRGLADALTEAIDTAFVQRNLGAQSTRTWTTAGVYVSTYDDPTDGRQFLFSRTPRDGRHRVQVVFSTQRLADGGDPFDLMSNVALTGVVDIIEALAAVLAIRFFMNRDEVAAVSCAMCRDMLVERCSESNEQDDPSDDHMEITHLAAGPFHDGHATFQRAGMHELEIPAFPQIMSMAAGSDGRVTLAPCWFEHLPESDPGPMSTLRAMTRLRSYDSALAEEIDKVRTQRRGSES